MTLISHATDNEQKRDRWKHGTLQLIGNAMQETVEKKRPSLETH